MALERWTNPTPKSRTRSPVPSCRGESACVAKRPRERSPTRNPSHDPQLFFAIVCDRAGCTHLDVAVRHARHQVLHGLALAVLTQRLAQRRIREEVRLHVLTSKLSASPSELLASPSELSASPSELLASPSELLASPSELSASPRELLASPSELLASPSELLASPSELLASPSELLPAARHAHALTREKGAYLRWATRRAESLTPRQVPPQSALLCPPTRVPWGWAGSTTRRPPLRSLAASAAGAARRRRRVSAGATPLHTASPHRCQHRVIMLSVSWS
jgi:hypothetical protein